MPFRMAATWFSVAQASELVKRRSWYARVGILSVSLSEDVRDPRTLSNSAEGR